MHHRRTGATRRSGEAIQIAGRPKRRAMIGELERLTREFFDVETADNPHSHLDYAIAQIESGIPIAGLARSIAGTTGLDIQRHVLSKYLHDSQPDADERLAKARPTMAHAMAEDALGIVDEKVYDKLDVARNALRARTREGLAKMFNPEFNQNRQPTVQVNIGTLHLDALRSPTLTPHARVSLMPAIVADSADAVASS